MRSVATTLRTQVAGLVLLGGLGVASCQAPGAANPGGALTSPEVGSVSFELTLGGKYQFDSVSYDISGNGFNREAAINVAGSSTVSALVSAIPMGTGYVATLTAQDAAGKLTPCTGSAAFAVAGAATVAVPVHMSCSVIQQTATGSGGAGGTIGGAGAGGGGSGGGGTTGAGGAGGATPPAVPVPRGAAYALAALLAGLGAIGLRRRGRS